MSKRLMYTQRENTFFFIAIAGGVKVDERSKSDENSGGKRSHSLERQSDCSSVAEAVHKP